MRAMCRHTWGAHANGYNVKYRNVGVSPQTRGALENGSRFEGVLCCIMGDIGLFYGGTGAPSAKWHTAGYVSLIVRMGEPGACLI